MMHGFGMMGGFSLLWLIIPIVLVGAGAATAILFGRNRRRKLATEDPARLEGARSGFAGRVFSLARENGGELTISDVVVETGRGPAEVEAEMNALVDGIRVTMEVDENGRIRYEFPELKPR